MISLALVSVALAGNAGPCTGKYHKNVTDQIKALLDMESLQKQFDERSITWTKKPFPVKCRGSGDTFMMKCDRKARLKVHKRNDTICGKVWDSKNNELATPKWRPKFGECDTTCGSSNRGYHTYEWQCMEGDSVVDEKHCDFGYPRKPDMLCIEDIPSCPCTKTHTNVELFMELLDTEALNEQLAQGIPYTEEPISVKCKDAPYTMEMQCDDMEQLMAINLYEDKSICGKWWDSENWKVETLTEGCTSIAESFDFSLHEPMGLDFPTSETFEMKKLGWFTSADCKYGRHGFITLTCETRKDATGKDVTALYQEFGSWDDEAQQQGECPQQSCSWLELSDRQKEYVHPEQLKKLQDELDEGKYREMGHKETLQCDNEESKMLLQCQEIEGYEAIIALQGVDGYVNECPETKNKNIEDRLLRV